MTENKTDNYWSSRRSVLTLLGAGTNLASSFGAGIIELNTPEPSNGTHQSTDVETDRGRQDMGNGDDLEDEQKQSPGENIEAYGAEPNPDDSSVTRAKQNLIALHAAATAAGEGGTIYIPPGTYYIGHNGNQLDSSKPYVRFGRREPRGISIVGEGPETSAVAISEHVSVKDRINQSAFSWMDGYDHGTIVVENIKLDGNYAKLPNLIKAGGGSWGLQVDGTGAIRVRNAYICGWHLSGIRGRHMVESVTECTFKENGIGAHNDVNGNANSHHISTKTRAGDECLIQRCHFIDCAGNAINIRRNDGTLRMTDCYVEGTGSALCKLSGGGTVEFKRIYHESNTESLEQKVSKRDGGNDFYGRNFIKSLGERGGKAVTLRTEHIESRNIREYALLSRSDIGDGPPNVIWEGDMVAIHNANMVYGDEAIIDANEGTYKNVDVYRLSVHDSGGDVFSTKNSDGRIKKLNRGNNVGGLGEPGNITIESDNEDGEPFLPNVPNAEEVGINSGQDSPCEELIINRSRQDDR